MLLKFRGWGRNMGTHKLGDLFLLDKAKIAETTRFNEVTISRSLAGRGLSICFGANVQMHGRYYIRVELTRSDIALLFYLCFRELTVGQLTKMLSEFASRFEK